MGVVIGLLAAVIIGLVVFILWKFRKPEAVETKEMLLRIDSPPVFVFTGDSLELRVKGFIIYEIVDEKKFQKSDNARLVDTITRNIMHEIIGTLTFEEFVSKREFINGNLAAKLTEFLGRWGVFVVAAGINHVEAAEGALRGIYEKTYIEHLKKANPDEKSLDILKLRSLEIVAHGQATKIYGPENIELLK